MPSARLIALAAIAAALVAAPVCYTVAQPADPKPATAPATDASKPEGAGRGQPGGSGAGQPGGPGPGGPGGGRGGQRGDGPGGGRGSDSASLPQSIKQSMMIMNRAMRTLSKQIADPAKKDENLKLIADMQRGCLAAKALAPEKALNKAPDQAKKDEMSGMYRKDLILLMEKLLKIESAVLEGKGADAEKMLGEIGELRDQGHGEFNVRD